MKAKKLDPILCPELSDEQIATRILSNLPTLDGYDRRLLWMVMVNFLKVPAGPVMPRPERRRPTLDGGAR